MFIALTSTKRAFSIAVANVLLLLWQLKSFHCLIMRKVKICLYCYVKADILTKVLQKCLLSSPLPNKSFLSKSLNLVGCYANRKAKFEKKNIQKSSPQKQ